MAEDKYPYAYMKYLKRITNALIFLSITASAGRISSTAAAYEEVSGIRRAETQDNADFPRKKHPDPAEIFISAHPETPKKEDIVIPHSSNRVSNPWSEVASMNNVTPQSCDAKMNICLEMYSVLSLMDARTQDELTTTLRHVLMEGENELPYELDVFDVEVTDQIVQGRRLQQNHKRQMYDQTYPLLVCFSMSGEYQSSTVIDCESVLHAFLTHHKNSFREEFLESLKKSDKYFQTVDDLNVVASASESSITLLVSAAEEQEMYGTASSSSGTDTAMIASVVIGSVALIALAFAATMLMQYKQRSSDQHTYEFDIDDPPEEIAVAISEKVAWPLDDFDQVASKNSFENDRPRRKPEHDSFSGKRHPWGTSKVDKTSSSQAETEPRNNTKKPVDDSAESKIEPDAKEPPNEGFTGECFAPPGKLGVAIDSVQGIPVVHRIKSGSPLEGILFHMDRIVAIDEVDTSSMSAADVTKLMVSKMNKTRKISFIRGFNPQLRRKKK